jgi:hypothetical protein
LGPLDKVIEKKLSRLAALTGRPRFSIKGRPDFSPSVSGIELIRAPHRESTPPAGKNSDFTI